MRGSADPVAYVPEAQRADLARRPEATIGFASRAPLAPHRAQPNAGRSATVVASPPSPAKMAPAITPAGRASTPRRVPSASIFGVPPEEQAPAATRLASLPPDGLAPDALAVVSGTIRGVGNAPLSGAIVCLDHADHSPPFCVANDDTAADGTYAMSADPGDYLLRVYDPSNVHVPGYWTPGGMTIYEAQATTISVGASNLPGKDITLIAWPRVRGTMTDTDGQPIEGLVIDASNNVELQTAADGTYAIRVFPNTSITVMVNATFIYRRGWYSSGGFVTDETAKTPIAVTTSDVTGISLTVPKWPTISGTLLDADGLPANASLTFTTAWAGTQGATTRDGDTGAYRYYVPFGGSVTVQAGGNGDFIYQQQIVVVDDDAVLDIVVHRYPVVSGTVTDSDDQPIQGIKVQLQQQFGQDETHTTTGADGSFSLPWYFGSPFYIGYQDANGVYLNGYLGVDGFTIGSVAAESPGRDAGTR